VTLTLVPEGDLHYFRAGHAVAKMIQLNCSIQQLDIAHNQMDQWGLVAIESALGLNSTLIKLTFSHTQCRQRQYCNILRRLNLNQTLLRRKEQKSSFSLVPSKSKNPQDGVEAFSGPFGNVGMPIDCLQGLSFPVVRLVLSNLGLTDVPNLSGLSYLEELVLSRNRLKEYSLPAHAESLRVLDLSFNLLESIPKCLENHVGLRTLHLNRNQITDTSEIVVLASMKFLMILNLAGNWINSIPLAALQNLKLSRLNQFYIEENSMHPVKAELYRAFFLQSDTLDLSDTGLVSLPNDFMYLSQFLRRLNLSRNQISQMPPQLCALSNLRHVLLKDNNFQDIEDVSLPSSSDQLQVLMSNNEFSRRKRIESAERNARSSRRQSRRLSTMSDLRDLSGMAVARAKSVLWDEEEECHSEEFCPDDQECELLESLSPRSSIGGSRGTLDVSSEVKADSRSARNRIFKLVKIMHVGEDNQLANFAFDCLPTLKEVDSNRSVAMGTHPVRCSLPSFCQCQSKHCSSKTINIELYRLPLTQMEMWNFCGVDTLQIQFFPNEEAIYVVYFDQGKPVEPQVTPHLQIIHSSCVKPFVILAGFTSSQSDSQLSSEDLKNEVAAIQQRGFRSIRFVHLLEMTPTGLSQLLGSIVTIIRAEKSLSIQLNTKDKMLIDVIENEKEYVTPPIVSYSDLSAMARNCCLDSFSEPKPIVRYLSKIGRVLFIDDHNLGLTDVVILNRNWAVSACLELLCNATVLTDGVISLSNLGYIWKPPCYPTQFLGTISALLIKYEIACVIETTEGPSLLFPSKMPLERPLLFDLWPSPQDYFRLPSLLEHPQPQLGRRLTFMPRAPPHNFMGRLIVRLLKLSVASRYWQNGIVIEREGNRVLVELCPCTATVTFQFRRISPGQTDEGTLIPFVRLVMEIARLLTESYRVPFEFSVLSLSPLLGMQETLDLPEAKVYQDLLDNVYHTTGPQGEKILYSDIAPDILLCDLWGDKIDFEDVQMNAVVGQGAFGKVYRGVYLPTQTEVAIKEMQNLDSEALQAFSREVWMLQ
jgi:hypothetical protein